MAAEPQPQTREIDLAVVAACVNAAQFPRPIRCGYDTKRFVPGHGVLDITFTDSSVVLFSLTEHTEFFVQEPPRLFSGAKNLHHPQLEHAGFARAHTPAEAVRLVVDVVTAACAWLDDRGR